MFSQQLSMLTYFLLLIATNAFAADDDSDEKKEKPLRLVPLITSTPLTGTGVGAAASYLYKMGEDSATSQLQVGGQYSITDSITQVDILRTKITVSGQGKCLLGRARRLQGREIFCQQ